jgi:hypothetical protein
MSNNDRPMLQAMDACDSGRHKLEPRYNFAKEGTTSIKFHICDVCVICGHQVLAPFTVQQQLNAGVVTQEEVRDAMRLRGMVGHSGVTLEQALAVVVERGLVPSADSKECTGEAPKGA